MPALPTSGQGSLGAALLAKTIGNAGLNAATIGLNFVIAFLLSRFLGSSGYGAVAFGIALSTILTVPALLGLPALIVREIAASRVGGTPELARGVIRRSNQAVIVASLIVCAGAVVCFAVTGWPHAPFRAPAVIGLGCVPLVAIISVRQSAMQGFGQTVLGRVPEAIVYPVLVIAFVVTLRVALSSAFSSPWAMAAIVVAQAVAVVLGAVLMRRATPSDVRAAPHRYETRRWAFVAVPLLLMSGVGALNDQVGAVLLGSLSDAKAVGVFSVATRAAALIPFLLLAAIPTLMPSVAELHARHESERLQRLMTNAAKLVFYASLPIVIGVVVLAEPLMKLFGSSFSSGATSLRILALGQIVNIATGFPGMILMMMGESKRVTWSVSIGAVVNLALSLALIPGLGATGAAAAAAASIALTNVLLSATLWRSKRFWSPALAVPALPR